MKQKRQAAEPAMVCTCFCIRELLPLNSGPEKKCRLRSSRRNIFHKNYKNSRISAPYERRILLFLCLFISPEMSDQSLHRNTVVAGPVMYTRFSWRFQRIWRSPPSSLTVTGLSSSTSPFRVEATATAQAPVPQARVSPEPRSHTRIWRVWRSMTLTNSVLILIRESNMIFEFRTELFDIKVFQVIHVYDCMWDFP